MKVSLIFLSFLIAGVVSRRTKRPVQTTQATEATTEAATTASSDSVDDDAYMTLVKAYIDAGTCDSVSSNDNCGDDATSYFKSFTYNGKNVIISSQVPDHDAENDQLVKNPNTRCERWQFIQLPINPSKASSSKSTGLGTIGLAVTGGAIFNHLSSPDGDVAFTNEGPSLDSCFGHSAPGGAYHYHANINCTDAGAATGANEPDQCVHIGYLNDGVPVYGFCKDTSGMQMTSCYSLNDGVTTTSITHVSGTYAGLGSTTDDYSYDQDAFDAGSCNLDSANGAIHPTTGEYSYFMTTEYPWVPIQYYGSEGESSLCSAA